MQTISPQTTDSTTNLFAELDLKIYLRILWHWSWLLVLCTLFAAVAAYITSTLAVPIYQASTTLLIDEANKPTANYQDLLASERIARTYAALMERQTVLTTVAATFNVDTDVLAEAITDVTVTPVRDTQLVQVVVEGISPELVAAVANTLPTVFVKELNEVQTKRYDESKRNLQSQLSTLENNIQLAQIEIDEIGTALTAEDDVRLNQLRNELAQYKSSYATMLSSYEQLRLIELQSTDNITIVEAAIQPIAPIRPRILVNTLLAAIVGAMLALGVIFLIEYMDDRIRTPQDLYSVLDTPILGTIARLPGSGTRRGRKSKGQDPNESDTSIVNEMLIVATQPRHPIAESYRRLRTNLRFSSVNEPLRAMLVTSAAPSEGKTTTASNLAIAMAQAGNRVIIMDADLRKPQVHKVFKLSKGPGLTDALLNDTPPAFFLRETTIPNLQVMTCGSIPPNPAELLGSQPMQELIQSLVAESDLLIIDAPPLLAVTDAQILSSQVQGVLMVVNSRQTSRSMVANGAANLQQVGARLLGVVLNEMTRSARGYYYYDSYAAYYADDESQIEDKVVESKQPKLQPTFSALAPKQATKVVQMSSKPPASEPRGDLREAQPMQHATTNGYYQLQSDQKKP